MINKTQKAKYVTYADFTSAIETMTKRFDALPTKDDLKGFATKDDLEKSVSGLALHLVRHDEEFRVIKETMATKADVNLLNNRFDDYAKKFTFFYRRAEFNTNRFGDIDDVLKNHEGRLAALESKPSQAA